MRLLLGRAGSVRKDACRTAPALRTELLSTRFGRPHRELCAAAELGRPPRLRPLDLRTAARILFLWRVRGELKGNLSTPRVDHRSPLSIQGLAQVLDIGDQNLFTCSFHEAD